MPVERPSTRYARRPSPVRQLANPKASRWVMCPRAEPVVAPSEASIVSERHDSGRVVGEATVDTSLPDGDRSRGSASRVPGSRPTVIPGTLPPGPAHVRPLPPRAVRVAGPGPLILSQSGKTFEGGTLALRRVGHGGQGTAPTSGEPGPYWKQAFARVSSGCVRQTKTPPRRVPRLTPPRGRASPFSMKAGALVRHYGWSFGCMATARTKRQ